ncbi:MAG: hypothetical protein AABY00_02325 [Nanoarchaeota archaeon]
MRIILAFFVLSIFILPASFGASDFGGFSSGSSFFSSTQYQPNFQTYYGGGSLGTYWPILSENGRDNQCEARQDILITVAPAGCQPAVVRSDLLAEQNVPVFCQLDALKLNPLIDIREIRDLQFRATYPKEVIGAGFHPARAALKTKDRLLGSPLTSNIGYAVVILRKNANESSLPSFINTTLSARVDYESGNALGIGRTEFLLTAVDDETWSRVESKKQSFWQGRYSVRLEQVNSNFADISIYYQDRKIAGTRVERGKLSSPIYLPGSYCQAGLQAAYDDFVGVGKKARIEVGDTTGLDSFDVTEGSAFLDGRCVVERITIDNATGITGNVSVRCSSGERIALQINQKRMEFSVGDLVSWRNDGRGQIWTVKEYRANDKYLINSASSEQEVFAKDIKLLDTLGMTSERDKAFKTALDAYETVAEQYPAEKQRDVLATPVYHPAYGEKALEAAITLSQQYGKSFEEARLIQKLLDRYPEMKNRTFYSERLQELYAYDTSLSSGVVYLDGKYRTLRVVSISDSSGEAYVELQLGNEQSLSRLNWRGSLDVTRTVSGKKEVFGSLRLDDLNAEEARITPFCVQQVNGAGRFVQQSTITLRLGESAREICGQYVTVSHLAPQRAAKIRLVPKVVGTRSEVNVTIGIGIEKRAIQLSPQKTQDKIDNLNESIKKWESISKKLGTVVSGLKSACFATSAVLTAKTFLSGLQGDGIARQQVMRGPDGWTNKCNDLVNNEKKYATLNACYLGEANAINTDVKAKTESIKQVNQHVQSAEAGKVTKSGILGEKSVDTRAAAKEYARDLVSRYKGEKLGTKNIEEVIQEDCYERFECDYTTLRNIEHAILSKRQGVSETTKKNINGELAKYEEQILLNKQLREKQVKDEELKNQGYAPATLLTAGGGQKIVTPVVSLDKVPASVKSQITMGVSVDKTVTFNVNGYTDSRGISFPGGTYVAGVKQTQSGEYLVQSLARLEPGGTSVLQTRDQVTQFTTAYKIGSVVAQDQVSYSNKYQNPEVRFFETEPYKGMPAVVPFDTTHGWYAATKQTLPTFGGIGGFESNGRVSSFWLCNVGSNKREEFQQSDFGDDLCQLMNLNTGQSLGNFPGLGEQQSRELVNKAIRALTDAAQQYGNKPIKIGNEVFTNIKTAANIPTVQCQDFMDPKDCHILFNVCDPVICPASRCDFGGKYPVADVVQSGIVGSTLLCLPNVREKIAVPVCLTGIHAGIDAYVSILKSHRDCLRENLATGKTVGICDQITSIYLCEFFWRQFAPLANVILPKLVESAYGGNQGARGGGEYMTVMGAWQNMQKSLDYFTQTYAVNSLKSYRIRSIEEAGTPICKAFVSAGVPTKLKNLVEPDSPPQFSAWFSSVKFTDATVPATAQYKVFYHIFSGKDSGVQYRVYLKSPPDTSYYSTSPYVPVAAGFIGKGEYATQTKDFTAPEGYRELCVDVNGQEECGFKQVSTSFAVNQIRDAFVSDELKKTDINSEKECVSGSASLSGAVGAALTNTNPGAAGEEALVPGVYQRGIIRICSTANPGNSTNPRRFVDVGSCGEQRVRCWLDKESVDRAITDNNLGVKNDTLKALEAQQIATLQKQGTLLSDTQIPAFLSDFRDKMSALTQAVQNGLSTAETRTRANALLVEIDNAFGSRLEKLVLNNQKAEVLLLKAQIAGAIAQSYYLQAGSSASATVPPARTSSASPPSSPSPPLTSSSSTASPPSSSPPISPPSSTVPTTPQSIVLKGFSTYDPGKKQPIFVDGKDSGVYLQGGKIYREGISAEIGAVMNSGGSSPILSIFNSARTTLGADLYDTLNGGTIVSIGSEVKILTTRNAPSSGVNVPGILPGSAGP